MLFASLDIETSNLNADFGYILCAVVKPYRDKPKIFRIDDYKEWVSAKYNDKPMIKELVKHLNTFDGLVTYFGRYFDIPFLRSQIIAYDLPRIKDMFHIDVHQLVRYKLKLHNNKLQTLIEYLNTYRSGKKRIEEKTHINALYYRKAVTGDRSGINELSRHCIKDVIALEQCYDFLKSEMRALSRSYM